MKFLQKIFKKEELKNKVKRVIHRFPLSSVICAIVTALLFLLIANNFSSETSELIGRIILSCIVVFFLSMGVTIFLESYNKNNIYSLLWHVFPLIFWFIFYLSLSIDIDSPDTITFFILTLFGIISLLFSAPYLKYIKDLKFSASWYYVYFYRISTVMFMSLVVWGALALGWSLAILAVSVLFDLWYSISGDLYWYWISLALTFLTPLFALSQLPEKWDFENETFNENVFFTFLVRYIAIPFIYVYFFILYAYTIKVLLSFSDWPKWEVSWMVIGFSLFWYITYMFSYIFETKWDTHSSLIHIFRKYFPFVVLPQVGMLFYAISLRIGQYDLTMNRYFVVVFGLWLLICSLYLLISKTKTILFIPALLTIFTLIISLWPWSVYNLPLERQIQRLENNLIEANILQNGKIIPLSDYNDISPELSNEIYGWIQYTCKYDECRSVTKLFPDIYKQLQEEDISKYSDSISWNTSTLNLLDLSRWEIIRGVSDAIKVRRSNSYWYQNDTEHVYLWEKIYPLDISWYDTFDDFYTQTNKKYPNASENYPDINVDEIYIALTDNWLSKWNNMFEVETSKFTGKIVIESATLATKESWKDKQSLRGIILIKNK